MLCRERCEVTVKCYRVYKVYILYISIYKYKYTYIIHKYKYYVGDCFLLFLFLSLTPCMFSHRHMYRLTIAGSMFCFFFFSSCSRRRHIMVIYYMGILLSTHLSSLTQINFFYTWCFSCSSLCLSRAPKIRSNQLHGAVPAFHGERVVFLLVCGDAVCAGTPFWIVWCMEGLWWWNYETPMRLPVRSCLVYQENIWLSGKAEQ